MFWFTVFLLLIAAVGIGIYLLFILPTVPGAVEERLGVREPLPNNLGVWTNDETSPEALAALNKGERRQVRTLYDEAKDRLILQVRYQNRETEEIVRVEPEQFVRRKRIKPA